MVKNRGVVVVDDDDDKEQFCPLCMEELDLTDRSFHPCRCGYQVCLWCFHNIQDKLNGLCPACRTPYDKSSLNKLDPNLLAAAEADRKRKKEQQRVEKATARAAAAAAAAAAAVDHHKEPRLDRSALQNVRVMQRNLVYITGLPPSIAKEDILKRKEHFGKFGRIVKVAVNKKTSTTTFSAYVTFKRNADASDCISHINSLGHESKSSMRATFGTTKYCSFFLRHIQCNNPGCLYLHDLANESECFTKEDLQHDFQMDEFDLDYHNPQQHLSEPATSNPVSSAPDPHPRTDNAPSYRSTTPQPAITGIPGDSPVRNSTGAQTPRPPAPSAATGPGTSVSGPFIQKSSAGKAPPDQPLLGAAAAAAAAAAASCSSGDAAYSIAPASPVSEVRDLSEPPAHSLPRPLSRSRRSFVIKDDDEPGSQILLPGISALGLGKADSGPFGWESQRNTGSRGSQRSTISPPDSPRTQHRVKQQMFRSLLPNVDVSFIPQPNPRSQDLNMLFPPSSRQQQYHHFVSQAPLVIDKNSVGAAVGPSPGAELRKPVSWCQTLPPSPYPSHFDGFLHDRIPLPPPPGLAANGNQMPGPPLFDRRSPPPPGMAPAFDPSAPGMMGPRFAHRSPSPAGFVNPKPGVEDFRLTSQRCPPAASAPSSGAPGLIQRPSVEPVLHINGAWFGM